MSTSHNLRLALWNSASLGLLTDYGGHVYCAVAGASVGTALAMAEDSNNPGTYYLNRPGGYYDIYVDIDKSGSPIPGDLKLSGIRHGLAPDDVSEPEIADGSIAVSDLSPAVISLIGDAAAAPDNVTIELNISGELSVKDEGITPPKIAARSIGHDQMADTSINTNNLYDGAVTTTKISDEAVTSNKIPDEAITSFKIADLAVGTSHLQDASVTADKILDETITGDKFDTTAFDQLIFEKELFFGNTQVTIKDVSIGSAQLADGSVTTSKLDAFAVLSGNISDEAVTTDKLPDEAVTTGKIADAAVTTVKILDENVTLAKLAPDVTALLSGTSYIINVLDYGASGLDAPGGSSQAFQDAFDAAGAAEGASIVVIPPGSYSVRALTVDASTTIFAYGATVKLDSAVPVPTGEADGSKWILKATGSIGSEKAQIRIFGGVWTGELVSDYTEQSTGTLFDFTACRDLVIRDAHLRKTRKNAVLMTDCFDATVEAIRIDGAAGVGIQGAGCYDVRISNSRITDCKRGIFFSKSTTVDSKRIFISNNSIDVYQIGIYGGHFSNSIITGNYIQHTERAGYTSFLSAISIGEMSGFTNISNVITSVTIANNRILWGPTSGEALSVYTNGGSFTNLVIVNNSLTCNIGISINFSTTTVHYNTLIKGNTIRCNAEVITTKSGIALFAGGSMSITFNNIYGFGYGISTNNPTTNIENLFISENRIDGGIYGAAFAKVNKMLFKGNLFVGTSNYAFYTLATVTNSHFLNNYFNGCGNTYGDLGTGNVFTGNVTM